MPRVNLSSYKNLSEWWGKSSRFTHGSKRIAPSLWVHKHVDGRFSIMAQPNLRDATVHFEIDAENVLRFPLHGWDYSVDIRPRANLHLKADIARAMRFTMCPLYFASPRHGRWQVSSPESGAHVEVAPGVSFDLTRKAFLHSPPTIKERTNMDAARVWRRKVREWTVQIEVRAKLNLFTGIAAQRAANPKQWFADLALGANLSPSDNMSTVFSMIDTADYSDLAMRRLLFVVGSEHLPGWGAEIRTFDASAFIEWVKGYIKRNSRALRARAGVYQ